MSIKAIFVLALVLFGCSQGELEIKHYPEMDNIYHPITLDDSMSDRQLEMAVEGIQMWVDSTEGYFDPPVSIGPVSCHQPHSIHLADVGECEMGEQPDGFFQVGYGDYETPYITVADGQVESRFAHTIAHEIGHYLGLPHGDGIMTLGWDVKTEVTEKNVSDMCEVWLCS